MGSPTSTAEPLDASVLISNLTNIAEGGQVLPSPNQLFAIGGLLFRLTTPKGDIDAEVCKSFENFVGSLPEKYWQQVLRTFLKATQRLVKSSVQDVASAGEALSGLFSCSPRLCQIGFSQEWISVLSEVYDRFLMNEASTTQKNAILKSISFLLLDGLFASHEKPFEERLLQAIQTMEEKSIECLGDLQGWQKKSEPSRRSLESAVREGPILGFKEDEDDSDRIQQREYILSMLESAQQREPTPTATAMSQVEAKPTKKTPKPVSAADEIERRIQQIKQILPEFGEGFIEAALSLHQGNVETTMSTLLNDPAHYPASLRAIDQTLPRRHKERAEEETLQAAEARKLVKERVALEDEREQTRYAALLYVQEQEDEANEQEMVAVGDEYDDDYDDVYDEADVKLGGADEGLYDFEQIKLYNQVAREQESEDSFWEDNRNTNRSRNKKQGGKGGEKTWGPDKMKGGRIPKSEDGDSKPNKPGKKGNSSGPRGGRQGNGGKKQNPPSQGGTTNSTPGNNQAATPQQKGKPRTKPKSNNRLNRQRDKKQKAQGTFGIQS